MHKQVAGYFDASYGLRLRRGKYDQQGVAQEAGGIRSWEPESESFSDIKGIDVVAYKTDIIGHSGLLFHLDWNTPGVSKGKDGDL